MTSERPEGWNDVTEQYGPRLARTMGTKESGTHRVMPAKPHGELAAPKHLARDAQTQVLTAFLRSVRHLPRARALGLLREALDTVGGLHSSVPQALAGQLVATLAARVESQEAAREFLAEAWEILAATGVRETA